MQTLITWFQNHQLFFIIYLVSSVIGYFAIEQSLKSDLFKQHIAKGNSVPRQKKLKFYIRIILLIFVHIPYINAVYAGIYVVLFLKGLFSKN